MCLYPKFIKNKRYLSYKTTIKDVPICDDYRKLYVPIGCGKCYECRKQKAQAWRVRLMEEIKNLTKEENAYFVTLTFSNEELEKLCKRYNKWDVNKVAQQATRLFLERWRKKYKKSVKHWLITELGHEGTERIHLHGILIPKFKLTNEILQEIWKYGYADTGQYVNEKTINYIVKYVTKLDPDHKDFEPIILCSSGIGIAFCNKKWTKQMYTYRGNETPEYYTLTNGNKVALPIYWRNKFYNQKERDNLWTQRLDKHTIFVNGIECNNINTEEGYTHYLKILKLQQEWNEKIGYGKREPLTRIQNEYKVTLKMLNKDKK